MWVSTKSGIFLWFLEGRAVLAKLKNVPSCKRQIVGERKRDWAGRRRERGLKDAEKGTRREKDEDLPLLMSDASLFFSFFYGGVFDLSKINVIKFFKNCLKFKYNLNNYKNIVKYFIWSDETDNKIFVLLLLNLKLVITIDRMVNKLYLENYYFSYEKFDTSDECLSYLLLKNNIHVDKYLIKLNCNQRISVCGRSNRIN